MNLKVKVDYHAKKIKRLTQRYNFTNEKEGSQERGTELSNLLLNKTENKMTNGTPGQNQTPQQPGQARNPEPLVLAIDPLKYIEHLPEYSGRGDELFTFIELVENIIPLILKYNVDSQTILLNRIKSKLRGKAREVIEINNHVNIWSEMKSVLVNNFGDKKSALQIFDELRSVTFTSNSVYLYNQIKSILRRLNNKVRDEPNSQLTIDANIQTGLNIFKDKLPEPMRSILFSRNPVTLEEALDILYEGNYAYYNPLKNNSHKNRSPRNHEQSKINFQRSNEPHNNNNTSSHNRNPNFRQNNYNQRSFSSGSHRLNRQQNFRQSQQPNRNFNNNNNNRPEPMDVDETVNSRVHSLETQNPIENFHLIASEDNSKPFLI